jgi:hypothetical protein
MARKNPRRNITRIDLRARNGKAISGWEVRIQRRRERVQKFFCDSKLGGKRAALRAAQSFRDQTEIKLKPLSVADRAQLPSKRNQSGTVGVRRQQQIDRRGDYEYRYSYWIAQWTDGLGRRKTRSFSVHQFGEKKARQLAVAAREAGVKRAKR